MKQIITILLLVLCHFSTVLFSQGLIFDSSAFLQREPLGTSRAELPGSASLKMYTPLLYPQTGSTCVAHSFANARTILLAKSLGWTSKDSITALSFSPFFTYYRNKSTDDINCEKGLNIETVAKDVLYNGFSPIYSVEYPSYYPFTKNVLCYSPYSGNTYPPSLSDDLETAKKFKLDEVYAIRSVKEMKTALAAGMPVIIGMFPPSSFKKITGELWTPQPTDKFDRANGHALLVIGYDDSKYGGAVELMNSWGDTWANKGFVWVKYKDLWSWVAGGYALEVEEEQLLERKRSTGGSDGIKRVEKVTLKVTRDNGKSVSTFNNEKFVKAFAGFYK